MLGGIASFISHPQSLLAESSGESIFVQPSEARLLDSSSDSDSASSAESCQFEHNGNGRNLYMISGEHFGMGDITQFSNDLIRLGERLDCLSCGKDGSDGTEILDSIEEDIAMISDEIEAILLLPKTQPITENGDIQVRQHIPSWHTLGCLVLSI
jgi:hypothetical protein